MKEKIEVTPEQNKNKLLIPFVVTLVGALMLLATLFLPFASATEDYRERLQKHPDSMYAEEISMTNEDAVNISLFEFGRMYAAAADMGISKGIAIVCLVLLSVFAILVILTALFSALKKPIAAIIFNLLSFGTFLAIKWDFADRGVLPSSRYDWGIAQVACYIGVIAGMAGAILLLTARIKEKRQNRSLGNE